MERTWRDETDLVRKVSIPFITGLMWNSYADEDIKERRRVSIPFITGLMWNTISPASDLCVAKMVSIPFITGLMWNRGG